MTLSQARATYGLSCRATPASPGASGSAQIGPSTTTVNLPGANLAYSLRCIFAGAGDLLGINLPTNDTTGSTAWVAGVQQVETQTVTAASGITGSGNATVTVTATGMTGSPKAISVALTTAAHTTATLIAAAIAAGLNADTDYAAMWIATSSGADVISKRKPTATYTVKGETINIWRADVANHNIAIANGTCTGITTASTSTATTAGVASDGCYIVDNGEDFEGNALATIYSFHGVLLVNNGENVDVAGTGGGTDSYSLHGDEILFRASASGYAATDTGLNFTAQGSTDLTITVLGTE